MLETESWTNEDDRLSWELVEGDFVKLFDSVAAPDLIFYDLFSSKSAALHWTAPFFERLHRHCSARPAELYTYSKTPHAWFTVYAPIENPEIVLTILVEEGGQGSDIAGPLAKELLKTYFERNE